MPKAYHQTQRFVNHIDEPNEKADVAALHIRTSPLIDCARLPTMVSDLHIQRTAKTLIREHGANADFAVARRCDKLLDLGDLEGLSVWWRVRQAVKKLQRTERE